MKTIQQNSRAMVVSNEASAALATKIAAELGAPFCPMTKKRFSDGEVYHAFSDDPGGRDLVIVGSTHTDEAHLELLDLIDGGHQENARTVNVIIPFLGYSTMERAKPGLHEIAKGISRTRQIFRARPHFVAFVDLHSEAVLHAHNGGVQTVHIHTDKLIVDTIRNTGLTDYVLVSPDYGRSKWVASLAGRLGAPHTAADKDRFATDQTMVSQVASVVAGKVAVICDDMIRTGGSIIQTAQRCREAGASDTMVMATHLVLSGDARAKFRQAGITRIIGADTFPGVVSDDLLAVFTVAPLIAKVVARHLAIESCC